MAGEQHEAMLVAGRAPGRRRTVVRLLTAERHQHAPAIRGYEPPTDLYETETEVVLRMEIAGLCTDAAHLKVDIQDRMLVIMGVRDDPAAGQRRRYDQIEIQTGPFFRALALPCEVDESQAVAAYQDGFLVVRLPKGARPGPRRTAVAIG